MMDISLPNNIIKVNLICRMILISNSYTHLNKLLAKYFTLHKARGINSFTSTRGNQCHNMTRT